LSNDGNRIAVDRTTQNNRDIYVVDVGRDGPRRLTFDAGIDAAPVWSPDGSRIVFRSSRNGVYDLYEKASSLDGTETLVYESSEAKTPNDWSPNGFLLYTHQNPRTLNDLFVLPLERAQADRTPRPFVQTPDDESQGVFSPDGSWVAYQSNEGGPLQVYVQPFPGPGGKQQISIAGGASPRWRPDGGELFFLSPEAMLMAVPIKPKGPRLDAGVPQPLFQTRLTGPFSGVAGNIKPQYDAAPGGRFLMNITAEETVSPITLILNWKPR
jgi:Tol biopolymer transport system component